jgi:CheY-like chemotaxis protein
MPTKTHKQDSESPRVVDVPLVCGNCGNRDWREFRYRTEGRAVHGKLFGRCTKCGQSHVFERGQWSPGLPVTYSETVTAKSPMRFKALLRRIDEHQSREKRAKTMDIVEKTPNGICERRISMKFLVVEEDRSLCAFYENILTRFGHGSDITGDGDEALRLYKKRGPYDAVLTNIGHPGLDGIELAESIRNHNPKQRIGFVCANPQSVPKEYPALGKSTIGVMRWLEFANEVANTPAISGVGL